MPIADVDASGSTVEPFNPELDAAVVADPERVATWLVYADWLEEHGDPRAELIRLQCSTSNRQRERVEAFVAAHFPQWFGASAWKFSKCEWKHGFVDTLALGELPEGVDSLRRLFKCRSLVFLRSLEVSGPPRAFCSLTDIERLPLLRELRIGIADNEGRVALLTPDGAMAQLLEALQHGPLLERLETLQLKTLSSEDVPLLLAKPEAFHRLGAGLALGGSERMLRAHRTRLRSSFPGARLFAIPATSPDFRYHMGGPVAHPAPRLAPLNFRELAPWVKQPKGREDVWIGSGVPFTDPKHGLLHNFSLCMACASADTLCIYSNYERVAGSFESYTFKSIEYLCRECGQFTSYENSRES